jgi:gliding motility-associated-like protein
MKKYTLLLSIIIFLFQSTTGLSQSIGNISQNNENKISSRELINPSSGLPQYQIEKIAQKTPGTLSVTPYLTSGYTPSSLVQNVLVSGCLVASNVTFTGDNAALGSFDANGSGFSLANGIIISTGNVTNAIGPNQFTNATTQFTNFGDPDLNIITGSNSTRDAAVLQFDFVPANNTVEFKYIFASEEYPEWACGTFNDVFAFLLSGPGISGGQGFSNDAKNIALLPDNITPVTINNIHIGGWNQGISETSPNPVTCPDINPTYYIDNIGSTTIEYDGMTTILTAHWTVIPCQTYHIKFAISDVADRKWDSGVFIEGASFTSNPVTMNNFNLNGTNSNDVYEGCNYNFEFSRNNPDNSSPLTIHYTVTGTSNALDHNFPTDSVIIPAGINSITVPYSIIADGIAEGAETLTISIGNGCPCSANAILKTLILHDPLTQTTNASEITCHGANNGLLTINATGGSGTYQYSLNGGLFQGLNSFPNLGPGTYITTIDDGESCSTVSDTIVLTDPVLLTLNAVISTNILCNNGLGVITASANGGYGSYQYSLNGGPDQSSGTFSGLTAGNYIVTVIDLNGCTLSDTLTLTEPSPLTTLVTLVNDASCNRFFDGSAIVTASGGTPGYSYSWSNGATTANNNYLSADTYFVTVTDNNGCTSTNSIVINEPTLLTATITSTTNASCNGVSNGSATVIGGGGIPPYSYLWSTGSTNTTVTGLSAGTYTVTVTDSHGCIISAQVIISQPTLIVPHTTVTSQVSCFGGNNGTTTINATGGVAPYNYNWSTGSTNDTLTGLTAGTYTVTVTDNIGCTVSTSVVINQPSLLNVSITPTNISCFNQNNGSATASANGGTAPYNFQWSTGSNSNTITNLAIGSYTVTVTDLNGCTATASVTITQPTLLTTSMTPPTNVACFAASNGSATVIPNGGTSPYNYTWSNGSHNGTATGLASGTYTVTVTDSHGCTATNSVIINQPPQLTSTISSTTNITCNGAANGTATITANGGVPPYSYTWSNGQHTTTISNLTPGTYTVTITDNNGCTATNSVTITQPALLQATITSNNVACFSGNNGSATASATGGTPPYSYLWSNGSSTQTINNLTTGTYTVTVTDLNSCTATATVSITQPTVLITSITPPTNVACYAGSNGSATVVPNGGTSPYNYTWSNGTHNGTATGLASGTYTVTVTDSHGCSATNSVVINQPPQLLTTISSTSNVSCNGAANGSATVSASGGVPAYSYNWSNGLQTTTINNLPAGTYTVTVTDNNGCTATNSVTISQPNLLSIVVNRTNVWCNGGNNGTANVVASGGSPPYSYLWSTGSTSNAISNLTPGNYSVTVTDANGCTATGSRLITQPTLLTTTINPANSTTCYNGNNGSATVIPSGGVAPYSYTWSDGTQNGTASGLTSGTYTVTVSDQFGCSATNSVFINQPTQITSTVLYATTVSCNGGNNGTTAISAAGGIPPYSYSWSNGATTSALTGLTAGNYTVTITDNNGCTATNMVTINQNVVLVPVIASTSPTGCFGGSDGSASATATGGTQPYSYSWSNGSVINSISNVASGSYTVTVTDINGCSASTTVNILDAPQLNPVITSTNIFCFGGNNGSATVNTSGGNAPYSYVWSTGSTASTISNLITGTYSVTVTDNNGCTATTSINLTQPTLLININTGGTDVSCFGGSNGTASVSVTGNTGPYDYDWSNGGTTDIITGLPIGNYSVTVTDSYGCAISSSVLINQPPLLTVIAVVDSNVSCFGGSNGAATVTVNGGATPYSYNWSNGATGANITGLTASIYSVTITDNNGCTVTTGITITQPTLLTATLSFTNVSCFGGNNGSASVVANGGTGPYTYMWSTENINTTISGLGVDTYAVTVTDNNYCTVSDSVTLTQPLGLASTISATPASCNGNSNGTATVVGSGGVSPYTYIWSNGLTTSSISGLAAGTYLVTITDQNGCNGTNTMDVNQPYAISITAQSQQNVSCFEGNNGSVAVVVSGGSTPYNYLWSNGSTNNTIGGLIAGNYQVTVTDNNGCSATAAVVIIQPALLTSQPGTIVNVSCFGGNNGSASVLPSGGTSPYNYSWSNGTTNQTTNNMTAGNYTVTITDFNGCFTTNFVSIGQPTLLTSSITFSGNVTCFGGNNGSATVAASGGTLPYSYLWSDGSSNATASNLTAGNYTVTVTDFNGCTTTSLVSISEPPLLTPTITAITHVSCFGGNNGSASVAANGGVAPFTYLWSNGSTNTSINNLIAGSYTVTATDNNGCTSTAVATVNQPSQTIFIILASTNVSCFGGNNGIGIASGNGTTGPYTYLWSNGATTASINNLIAGSYSVTVTDAAGCFMDTTLVITEPNLLVSNITSTNVSCNNGNNGTAGVAVTGGTAPYAFIWSTGSTLPAISGLTTGIYSVTITDPNGCSVTSSATITQPTSLTATLSNTNVSCFGGNNGAGNIVVSGGTMPYSYAWSNSDITPSINNLTAGNYTVTVTDANLCNITGGINVTQPTQLISQITTSQNATCFGYSNGSASVLASGGTLPYSYQWDVTGDTTASTLMLNSGLHQVVVTDGNGCTSTSNVTIGQPTQVTITTWGDATLCQGNYTTIGANAIGGTGHYSYTWDPSSADTNVLNVLVMDSITYFVFATDSNGCTSNTGAIVLDMQEKLKAAISGNADICLGESAILNLVIIGGVAPYTYIWDNGIGIQAVPFSVTPTATTTYMVTVFDACNSTPSSSSFTVTVHEKPVANISATDMKGCGTLTTSFVDHNWLPNNTYVWDFGDPQAGADNHSNDSTPTHFYSEMGVYNVALTVTSEWGCSAFYNYPQLIAVFDNPVASFKTDNLAVNLDNPIIRCMDESYDAVNWLWDFGEPSSGNMNSSTAVNPYHKYQDIGTHTIWLLVENEHGCKDSTSHDIQVLDYYTFYAPNAFSPNGDGVNDEFTIKGSGLMEDGFSIIIYDRWGGIVYEGNDINQGWNGSVKNNGNICPIGTYTWSVTAKDELNRNHFYTGSVTIIK